MTYIRAALARLKGLFAGAATRIVRNIAPIALIENVLTVAQIKDQSVSPRRLNAALISPFGILAVITNWSFVLVPDMNETVLAHILAGPEREAR